MKRHASRVVSPDRKPRKQSKIDKMPESQQRQVWDWMEEGLIYSEIARRVQKTLGVPISISSLSAHYSKHCREILNSQTSEEPLHLTLVFHVQIRPELYQPSVTSDGK
jgi:hypothetical protein